MKFNLKRMLGLLALGGAVAYVQKKGGLRNAGQGLKDLLERKGGKFGLGAASRDTGMRDAGMAGVRSGSGTMGERSTGFDDEPRGGFGGIGDKDIGGRPH